MSLSVGWLVIWKVPVHLKVARQLRSNNPFDDLGNESQVRNQYTREYEKCYPSDEPYLLNTIFVSSHMYPENPGGTQAIALTQFSSMGQQQPWAKSSGELTSATGNHWQQLREGMPCGHGSSIPYRIWCWWKKKTYGPQGHWNYLSQVVVVDEC